MHSALFDGGASTRLARHLAVIAAATASGGLFAALPAIAQTTPPSTPDTTAPTMSDNVTDDWTNGPVAVSISATDASGPVRIEYRIRRADGITIRDSGDYETDTESTTPLTTIRLSDGERVEYRGTDAVGNQTAWLNSDTARVDTHAPRTTASSVPTAWQNEDVDVTLNEVDAPETTDSEGSGIDGTSYRVGGGADGYTSWTAYLGDPITLENGEWLEYRSTDNVGNVQGVQRTRTARIDTVDPELSFDPAELSDEWTDAPVPVTLHINDVLSGIADGADAPTYEIWADGADEDVDDPLASGTFAENTEITLNNGRYLRATVTDRAGNSTSARTNAVRVDGKAPTTTTSVPTNGWVASAPFNVRLAAADRPDALNGAVGVAHTYFQVLDADLAPLSDPIAYLGARDTSISLAAGQRITVYSVDALGNREASHTSAAIRVDETAPSMTATTVSSDWQNEAPEITLTATDNESGVHYIEYAVIDESTDLADIDTWEEYDGPVTLGSGERLAYRAADNVRNVSDAAATAVAKVDVNSPSVSASDVPGDWQNARVTVELEADDDLSGVDRITYEVMTGSNAGTTTTYNSASPPTLGNGQHLRYRAFDEAGNSSNDETTDAAQVDTAAPSVGINASRPADSWAPTAVTATITADDDDSGVDAVEMRRVPAGANANAIAWQSVSGAVTVEHGVTLQVRAIDAVGNTSAIGSYGPAQVDTQAPQSQASGLPSGSAEAPVAVSLSATDDRSGVARITYQVVSASGSVSGSPITYDPANRPVLGNGESLRFSAVDNAGNVEASQQTAAVSVVPPTPAPTAEFRFASSGDRIVVSGRSTRLTVGCGRAACRLRVSVRFTSEGRTLVRLRPVVVTTPAGGTAPARLAVSASQAAKIRTLTGTDGVGGEVRITLTQLNAADQPIATPVTIRRGLRESVVR